VTHLKISSFALRCQGCEWICRKVKFDNAHYAHYNFYKGVNPVQRSELVRQLKKDGWVIKPGGKHGMAEHPHKPGKIPIPNGSQINDYTAKGILRSAGLL